ncbi:MAG: nitrite reductase [Bacillota bacterium]
MAEEIQRYVVTPGVGQVFFRPEQLALISQVAGPEGKVELNAFMQLIVHTAEPDLAAQQERLREAGLGVYPAGPVVKNLHTCTFCMGEKIEGLPDARRLDAVVAGTPVPFPVRVGFSGCASNCGEALVRDIGVVRMDADRYDIYIGGKPGSLSPVLGQKVAEGVSSEALVEVVQEILALYRETAKGKERFWKNVSRVGVEAYRGRVATYTAG